jgi:ATP-dependent RNA helicase DDX51/DBP6
MMKRDRDVEKAKKKHKKDKKQKKREKKRKIEQEQATKQSSSRDPLHEDEEQQIVREQEEEEEEEEIVQKADVVPLAVEPTLASEAKQRKKLLSNPEKLPDFMRQAHVIATGEESGFKELGLSDRVVDVLTDRMEFVRPFPVQAALVPFLMRETRYSGGDALIMSATGSGKTLAFALPVVELVNEFALQSLSCLCVLPTKDIALQVYDVFATLCEGSEARVTLLSGDRSFFAEQSALSSELPQIVVTTPGRLRDHLLTSLTLDSLRGLRWLVIDEGDRLLAEQYHQWLDDLMPLLLHPVDFVDGTNKQKNYYFFL